jgi:homoserine dehydrogenase
MMPTASAVVADVADIARDMLGGVAGRANPLGYAPENVRDVVIKDTDELDIACYIRFSAADRPGVLSSVSGVLGRHNISISSVIQKGREAEGHVPLVITTHHATERELRAAVSEIEELDAIDGKAVYIRIEENLGAAD